MKQRLNKLIAASGFCSRRQADSLITQARVTLNGKTVTELGTQADPATDTIAIDGTGLQQRPHVYLMLHKPSGYITTVADPHAEKTVFDLLPRLKVRLFPVGRLDKDTTGLLLLTNDGELSNQLTHPRYGVDRVYQVTVEGAVEQHTIRTLENGGLLIEGYPSSPCRICVLSRTGKRTRVELTLREGRKRQIRHMFGMVGHPVRELIRIRFGKLHLNDLASGDWRYVKKSEII